VRGGADDGMFMQLGGVVGDKIMIHVSRRNGGRREPEYRLYALVSFAICETFLKGLFMLKLPFSDPPASSHVRGIVRCRDKPSEKVALDW
jgi:hypothetical protein